MIYSYITETESELKSLTEFEELQYNQSLIETLQILDEQLELLDTYDIYTESSREDYIDLLNDCKHEIRKLHKEAKEAKKNKDKAKYIATLNKMKQILKKSCDKVKAIKPTKVETVIAIIIAFLKAVVAFWAGVQIGTVALKAGMTITGYAVSGIGGYASGFTAGHIIFPKPDTTDKRKIKDLSEDEKLALFNPYRNRVVAWINENINYCNIQIQYAKDNW